MIAYRKSHTTEESERVIHAWHQRDDEMLAAAIHNRIKTRVLGEANTSNGCELGAERLDYEPCRNRQMAEPRRSAA